MSLLSLCEAEHITEDVLRIHWNGVKLRPSDTSDGNVSGKKSMRMMLEVPIIESKIQKLYLIEELHI